MPSIGYETSTRGEVPVAVRGGNPLIAQRSPWYQGHMKLPAVLFVLFILAFSSLPMLPGPSETASAESLPAWTRPFHLHEGAVYEAGQYNWINSTGGQTP